MDSPEKSAQTIANNLKNCEEFVAKKKFELDYKNDELSMQQREESYDCESVVDSTSGFTEYCEFLVRCKRISRS